MTDIKYNDAETIHILIVEDSPTQAKVLRHILEKHHYKVSTVENGRQALELMGKQKPQLVITGIVMPEMDGYELCRRIKADSSTEDIPVILLTSFSDSGDVFDGLSCGADNFITKPFNENSLIPSIELIIANRKLIKSEHVSVGVEIMFAGKRHLIMANRQQMLTLLLSTYEAAVNRNSELIQTQIELNLRNQLISNMLHRYVDDSVIEQILANPDRYSKLGGDRKEIAVFFCDIRGFTSISEVMTADELIHLLNSIYKELTGIVFKNKGTLDKYMGDCIMAFWGAPTDVEDEMLWAVRAALEMKEAFEDLKRDWPPVLKKLGIGIGINYGEVVVGNIGTEERMDYTVIGDIVNTTERIESIALSGQVLITKEALSRIEGKIEFRALDPVMLKGKSQPIEIYEVLALQR